MGPRSYSEQRETPSTFRCSLLRLYHTYHERFYKSYPRLVSPSVAIVHLLVWPYFLLLSSATDDFMPPLFTFRISSRRSPVPTLNRERPNISLLVTTSLPYITRNIIQIFSTSCFAVCGHNPYLGISLVFSYYCLVHQTISCHLCSRSAYFLISPVSCLLVWLTFATL